MNSENFATINLIERPNHPMKVVSIKYDSKQIESNIAFEVTGDDWMKELEVTVQNVTSKEITYFEVEGKFPQTSDGKLIPDITFSVGRNTSRPPSRQFGEIIRVPPNSSISVSLSEQRAQEHIRHRQNFNYPVSLTKRITLYLKMVIYDDDTGWYKGSNTKRDPANPARWINTDLKQTSLKGPERLDGAVDRQYNTGRNSTMMCQ